MEVHLIKNNNTTNITEFAISVSISGEYRSACRTLDISFKNNSSLKVECGDLIEILEESESIFYGIVWDRNRNNPSLQSDFHCKNFGIYLLKNSYNYKFNGTPEALTQKISKQFNILIGYIAKTGVNIKKTFIGKSLYEIIMTAYTVANTGKYMIRFNRSSLEVIKKGEEFADKNIIAGDNLISSSVSESLDNMVNTIYVTNKDDKLIDTIRNSNDVKKYGTLSNILKVDNNSYKEEASKMLKGIETKIKVTNFGDTSCVTGNAVIVEDIETNLKGKFYIDADTHTWKNGIYTNSLTLNFKNIMDEKEAAEAESKKKNKKNKKNGKQYSYIVKPD